MTRDHPESQETTFKEITVAASLPFQHHSISQTQDEQLHQGEAEHGAGRQNPPSSSSLFHLPSAHGLPWSFSLGSPPRLCQGCCEVEVMGYCQQGAGNYI